MNEIISLNDHIIAHCTESMENVAAGVKPPLFAA